MSMNLSDSLERIEEATTYALFAIPVGRFENPHHSTHKQIVLDYIESLAGSPNALQPDPRPYISRNITQVGPPNILELPQFESIKSIISTAIHKLNEQSFAYNLPEEITFADSYLELGQENAMYAPHEHSNVLYSGTYFINFDIEQHAPLKFRRTISSTYYPVLQYDNSLPTAFNQLESQIPYSEGDILLHPPNLQHGYEQPSHPNRLTLSFNVSP